MTGKFSDLLAADPANQERVANSDERWLSAVRVITADRYFADTAFTVFVAGSMGRSEMGVRSDIDLFLISRRSCDESEKVQLISSLDKLNANLGYPPFGNRRFLKVYQLDDLLQKTGSPQDDNENCFTVRMLLLLESRVLANKETYSKNINLKFSRMLTVFATVAALTVHDVHSMSDFRPMCDLTPIRRLALALDLLDDNPLLPRFRQFLTDYEQFLCWKEDESIDTTVQEDSFKQSVRSSADRLSDFLYDVLMHQAIPDARRKFLVI